MINKLINFFGIILIFILLYPINQAHSMEKDETNSNKSTKRKKEQSVSEAFLKDSIINKNLKDSNKKQFSKRLQKDAELYLCEESSFNSLFPVNAVGSTMDLKTDKSYFSGQIRITKDDDGIGTGTLVDMKEDVNGEITIIGITALHNFVGFDKKGINIPLPGDRKFSLGSKYNGVTEIFSLGYAEIDKVMVPTVPSKDMCIFEGLFSRNEFLFNSNKEFFNEFHHHIPIVVKNEITNKDTYKSTIYHYPLGKKDQRKNNGDAFGTGLHKIESLFGSSGASLFNDNFEIFGIHTGASGEYLDKEAVVEYDGIEDIPVSNFNLFEKISHKDYTDSINGVELLRGNLSKTFKSDLSLLVESMSVNN